MEIMLECGLDLRCLVRTEHGEHTIKRWLRPANPAYRYAQTLEALAYANATARELGVKRTFRELFA